jgi:hypothetical protein
LLEPGTSRDCGAVAVGQVYTELPDGVTLA